MAAAIETCGACKLIANLSTLLHSALCRIHPRYSQLGVPPPSNFSLQSSNTFRGSELFVAIRRAGESARFRGPQAREVRFSYHTLARAQVIWGYKASHGGSCPLTYLREWLGTGEVTVCPPVLELTDLGQSASLKLRRAASH